MYFAVFDANNFYVSCERVFTPSLQRVPTVVTSSAGGIILARSNEVKELGIPMGAPVFKVKELLEAHQVQVRPANFGLYSEMSGRVTSILHQHFSLVEEYSIDECFIVFPDIASAAQLAQVQQQCQKVRDQIQKWTGIPVSVGIAQTKTLAKVAVKVAKKLPEGVFSFFNAAAARPTLEKFTVQDIWGIGRALGPKLLGYGIQTAAQLADADPLLMRKRFSVVLAHTINELRGISCFSLAGAKPAQTTAATGTFDKELTTRLELERALHNFATRAAMHLRREKEVAGGIVVFVRGNRFKKDSGNYVALQTVGTFSPATAYTPHLLNFVSASMDKLFFEGVTIKRAGVFLFNLVPVSARQINLFESEKTFANGDKEQKLMNVVDSVEKRWAKRGACASRIIAQA